MTWEQIEEEFMLENPPFDNDKMRFSDWLKLWFNPPKRKDMKKNSTKKSIHQAINTAVYNHINKHFPSFNINDSEGYGRIYFTPKNGNSRNIIEYHQSRHDFCLYDSGDPMICVIVKELERVVEETKAELGL